MRTNESSSTSKIFTYYLPRIKFISFLKTTISSSADESGIKLLKRYYCQLQLLRNRFPMLPETECSVRFTW